MPTFAGTERFELRRQIGQGGMGVVYEAHDRVRDMRVALKTLRRLDGNALLRFKREFRALSDFSHPNVIRLYELVAEGQDWFFTMELVEGQDLISYVRMDAPALSPDGLSPDGLSPDTPSLPLSMAATMLVGTPTLADAPGRDTPDRDAPEPKPRPGPGTTTAGDRTAARPEPQPGSEPAPGPEHGERLHLDSVVDRARLEDALGQLAQALEALHAAGLVHCDVKPSNVMVTRDGRVVLMDFGVTAATRLSPGLVELHGTGGTPAYMAPEQAMGEPPSAAADWYAFGVTLYLLLTGRLPFDSERMQVLIDKQERDPPPPSTLVEGIPPALDALCMRLLARDPAVRPWGDDVLEALGLPGAHMGSRHRISSLSLDGGGDALEELDVLDERDDVFVGRRAELAALHESYRAVCAGQMRCMVVSGPSGMGKSSLLLRFIDQCQDPRQAAGGRDKGAPGAHQATRPVAPLVLTGRCRERETLAYKAFDGLIDQLSLHLQDMPVRRRRAILPEGAPLLARLFPVLRRVKELDVTTAIAGGMELRVQAVHTLRALLAALAREQPIVACIDDLQWADGDSLDLLQGLLAPPAISGLLLLATVRQDGLQPDGEAGLARLTDILDHSPSCQRILLAPLAPDEQAELVARLGRTLDRPAADAVTIDGALLREAAGHPMLLTELVRHADEAMSHLSRSGALHLESVLWRRVTELPAIARALVEAMAVAGEPMPLGVLAGAVDLSPDSREQAHAITMAAHLMRITRTGAEPWLDAYHAKVREAVLQHLDGERTRTLHVRLAQAMERWDAAPVGSLARHWLVAGDSVRAAAYLLRSARTAAEQLAFAQTRALYRAAVELLDDGPDDADTDRLRCQAWLGLAHGLRLVDEIDEALPLLAHAEAVAVLHDWSADLADIYNLRGNLLFARIDLEGCMEQQTRACAYARKVGSVQSEAAALGGLGDAYLLRGQFMAAREHYARCVALAREHGFDDIAASNMSILGLLDLHDGNVRGTLRHGAAAMALAAGIGHQRAESLAIVTCLGRAWLELGWLDIARPYLERARMLSQSVGSRRFEATALAVLARLLMHHGRHDEAEAMADEASALLGSSEPTFRDVLVLDVVALVSRDPATRAQALARAEAIVVRGTVVGISMMFYRDAIEVALVDGDYPRMNTLADALEALTRAEPAPWSTFLVERARALAAFWQGRRDAELIATLDRLLGYAWQGGFHVLAGPLADALMIHDGRARD